MLLAASLGLIALAGVWVFTAQRHPAFLLPLYILAAIPPAPGAMDLALFPDLGAGGLDRPFPTDGDLLLLATAAHPQVARRIFRPGLAGAIVLLSLTGLGISLVTSTYPIESLLLYSTSFLRIGLMLAVLAWARDRDPSPSRWMLAIFGALCLFFGSAVVFVVGPHIGLQWLVDAAALREPLYGRLDFPRLGNNKIGLAMVMLTSALVLIDRSVEDPNSRVRLLVPIAICGGVLTCLIADLRFSTTSLGLLLLAYLLSSRRLAPYGLAAATLGAAAALLSPLAGATPRALSVLAGDFDIMNDSSLNSRLEMWQGAVRVWRESSLWGELGGWEYRRPVDELVLTGPLETHSEYLWWLASYGTLGLVAVLALLWAPARAALTGSPLTVCAVALSIGALALNAATLYPITGACLAMLSSASMFSARKRDGQGRAASAGRQPRKVDQA